jgi:hypothetical protein
MSWFKSTHNQQYGILIGFYFSYLKWRLKIEHHNLRKMEMRAPRSGGELMTFPFSPHHENHNGYAEAL